MGISANGAGRFGSDNEEYQFFQNQSFSQPEFRSSSNPNPIGGFGFGLDMPEGNFQTLAPIPEPQPIPLDGGSMTLLLTGIIVGLWFIRRKLPVFQQEKS